ncbi:MAG: class I SAM-dependent methyltransferase [Syntrophales bacterium]
MKKEEHQRQVTEVFIGVEAHQETAALIRSHSTNQRDIREVALANIDLQQCRRILDVGCGFGFFSEALRNKVSPTAHLTGLDMIPAYEPLFLEVCKRIGLQGRFLAAPVSHVHTLPDGSWDLVLCSYALYFFPEIISRIARLLTPEGIFVTITHAVDNMGELIAAARIALRKKGCLLDRERLPIEEIIGRFCAENGHDLLSPWFARIDAADYPNALIFKPAEVSLLLSYFHFKSPFFLTGIDLDRAGILNAIATHLTDVSQSQQGFTISKDDRIFICRQPRFPGGKP